MSEPDYLRQTGEWAGMRAAGFERNVRESGSLLGGFFEAGRDYERSHEQCIDCGDDIPRWTRPETPPKGWPRCEPCMRQY